MLSDLEIAQAASLKHIREISEMLDLTEDDLEYYGKYKAKVNPDVRGRFKNRPQAKYIDVTAITPTPLGEGKTVTTVGLAQALNYVGKKNRLHPATLDGPDFRDKRRRCRRRLRTGRSHGGFQSPPYRRHPCGGYRA